jgi:hypothetical protein
VVGTPADVQVEYHPDEQRVDHVWIMLALPGADRFRVALNTISRRNRDAGFDERIRVGVITSSYEQLPQPGIFDCDGLDYAVLEKQHNIFYEHHDKAAMQQLLTSKGRSAARVQVWGELYARNHAGIHEIHSRRTSCAVAEDIVGHDGAMKFFYAHDKRAEMLLFKFCGQP